MNNNELAYLIARASIGISMFTHGLVRFPKINKFSDWMTGQFQSSMLPETIVRPFSYALPFLEFFVGILLILGLFTRFGLLLGGCIMLMLLFGTGMIENWEAVPSQLIHSAFFAVLLASITYNRFSIDTLREKNG